MASNAARATRATLPSTNFGNPKYKILPKYKIELLRNRTIKFAGVKGWAKNNIGTPRYGFWMWSTYLIFQTWGLYRLNCQYRIIRKRKAERQVVVDRLYP